MSKTINLQAALDADPEAGIRIEIHSAQTFDYKTGTVHPPVWVARISQLHVTRTGGIGTPAKLMMVAANHGVEVPGLLDLLKALWEQGEVEVS